MEDNNDLEYLIRDWHLTVWKTLGYSKQPGSRYAAYAQLVAAVKAAGAQRSYWSDDKLADILDLTVPYRPLDQAGNRRDDYREQHATWSSWHLADLAKAVAKSYWQSSAELSKN